MLVLRHSSAVADAERRQGRTGTKGEKERCRSRRRARIGKLRGSIEAGSIQGIDVGLPRAVV